MESEYLLRSSVDEAKFAVDDDVDDLVMSVVSALKLLILSSSM